MDGIYFIGVGQSIFVAALLMAKERRSGGDHILLTWMLVSAGMLIFFYLNFIGATAQYIPLMIVGGCLPLLAAPLLYQYVLALTQPTYNTWKQWPHAVPFVFLCLYFLLYYQFFAAPGQIWISDGFIQRRGSLPFVLRFYPHFFAISSCLYPVISLMALFRHQRNVLNEFSFQESITLKWLRNWIVLEIVAFVISYAVIQLGSMTTFDIVWSFRILAALISFNIFVVGFFGLRQPIIFPPDEPLKEDATAPGKYKTSNLTEKEAQSILDKLTDQMENELIFSRQNLGINDLAKELDVSKYHVSQVINENLKTNFYDFVNRYRVKEFKKRLDDPRFQHLTMLGIALACGFSSKSSFNQVFKRLEGMTPTQYRANRSNSIDLDATE